MADKLLERMIAAATKAGDVIMAVYASGFEATDKADGSPVTLADQRAEEIIISSLADTGIPLLGEESFSDGTIPKLGDRYFIVDPLDGTKEFIKRNGEFTVNIALIEHGVPTLGVVLAPALDRMYTGAAGEALEYVMDGSKIISQKPMRVANSGPMKMVASRSHGSRTLLGLLCDHFGVTEDVSVGSSLKFCLVANGTARFYPRFTPTCEWDIAAGQAVLAAAGGAVLALDGNPMGYGKADKKFLNPFFAAAESTALAQSVTAKMRALLAA